MTDNFQHEEGRHYFYNQLAASFCLQMFHYYETIPKNREYNLEWNEFYRPAAANHIMAWLFVLEPTVDGMFIVLALIYILYYS